MRRVLLEPGVFRRMVWEPQLSGLGFARDRQWQLVRVWMCR
jgi:hypothetical protein